MSEIKNQNILDALEALLDLSSCRCHPSFKDRGLHDPFCNCDYKEDVDVVARYIAGNIGDTDVFEQILRRLKDNGT